MGICRRRSCPAPSRLRLGFWLLRCLASTPLGFVGVDAQIDRLVADGKVPSNLLGSPVTADIGLNALPKTGGNGFGIATVTGSLGHLAAGLLCTATLGDTATLDFAANGAGVSPHNAGNLGGAMLGSHKALYLVSFFLG